MENRVSRPSESLPWRLKASLYIGMGLGCFFLAPPLYRLSRAVEGLVVEMNRDCVVGIPEKPNMPGKWRLAWVQEPKSRGRK